MGKTDAAVMKAEFAEILPAVERWHAMAVRHSRIAIWCAACCGHELLMRKKEIGHGGWMKFLKVLPFSDETARKYMDLAVEWQERTGQIPTGDWNLKPALLAGGSRAVLDLTDEQFTEIAEHTHQAVGETTLRQLYFDWGICKPPHRPGGNLRKGEAEPRGALTQEEIYAACAGTWVRIVEDLTEHGRRQKTHIHLTDGEIEAHREGLKRVVDELDAELARRAKKAGHHGKA
jgi:hypothetical protein